MSTKWTFVRVAYHEAPRSQAEGAGGLVVKFSSKIFQKILTSQRIRSIMETRKGSKRDLADEVPRMFWFSVRLIAVMARGGEERRRIRWGCKSRKEIG